MKERAITDKIMRALRQRGIYVVKIHGGPMQQAGLPDLYCCVCGWSLWLEVKRPGEQPTPLQRYETDKLKNAGAYAEVVTSVDGAIAAVCCVLNERGFYYPDTFPETKPGEIYERPA